MTTRWTRLISLGALVFAGCSGGENVEQGGGGAGGSGGTMNATSGGSSGSSGSSTAGSSGDAPNAGRAGGGSAGSSAGGSSQSGTAGAAGVATSGNGGSAGAAVAGSGPTAGSGGAAAGAGGSVAGDSGSGGSAGSSGGSAGSGGELVGEATEMALASLPADRQEHAVAAANGEVFVFGGYAPDATASVIAYNPEQDEWRSVADFIGPFNHGNVGTIDDKIYLGGFYEAGGMSQASAQTFVYDPIADDWNELEPMPAGSERAASCVAVLGTKLYLFGGARNNTVVADSSFYDAAADSWTVLPPLPEPREHCTAGAIGDKLYIGGGRTHNLEQFEPMTWEFDPVSQMYAEKEPIPTPRGGCAGAVLGGRLFVFGGEGNTNVQTGVFDEIEAYDPATDSWEAFPPLAVPRHGFGAAVLDGRIYLPGGANRQGGAAHDAASVFFFE